MEVVLEISEQYLLDISADEFAGRLKLSTALLMFQAGQLSAGAACEFAGVDRYSFWDACRRYNIDVVDYDPDELDEDFAVLTQKDAASCS